ncbi:N-acetylmuramyl-L-alanine amidase, negative regulator of AmpC, AmpD [Gallionella capsiferriformans ES-2]|jgi:AmpD protein|uniref:1,6-anhydro-N-acetylmuramyl-L-alanine amidase AmpD n=2 Tax=Gallionella TaxID=96 RepID=D9SJR6_GALCS|nr:N-acetylmuramyl-L-alanine amidase, negative regulator of AmpC, AmpD [Gallionella capsiferriformans ES-2]
MMRIDQAGWAGGCEHLHSPNFDDRAAGPIELLVIHNISLPPDEFGGEGVQQLFTNTLDRRAHPYYQTIPEGRVSSHFYIRRDGHLIQFVSCLQRAWHAGLSSWQGKTRCNDFAVGIELEGSDNVPFTDAQYAALHELTLALRMALPIRGIAGHSHIAPVRKTDPGPFFDWQRYLAPLALK